MDNRETSTRSGRQEDPPAHQQIFLGVRKSHMFRSSPVNKNMVFQRQGEEEKSFSFAIVKSVKAISCPCLRR